MRQIESESRQKRRDWQFEIPSLTCYAANSIHTICTPRHYRGATNEDVPETSWCPPKHQSIIFKEKDSTHVLMGRASRLERWIYTYTKVNPRHFFRGKSFYNLQLAWHRLSADRAWDGVTRALHSFCFKNLQELYCPCCSSEVIALSNSLASRLRSPILTNARLSETTSAL